MPKGFKGANGKPPGSQLKSAMKMKTAWYQKENKENRRSLRSRTSSDFGWTPSQCTFSPLGIKCHRKSYNTNQVWESVHAEGVENRRSLRMESPLKKLIFNKMISYDAATCASESSLTLSALRSSSPSRLLCVSGIDSINMAATTIGSQISFMITSPFRLRHFVCRTISGCFCLSRT